MKNTGPSDEIREAVTVRSDGTCEACNRAAPMSIHHRMPRKMGGTNNLWINSVENLLALCGSGVTGCHGRIESNRADSYDRGLLLRSGMFPWLTPFMDDDRKWWLNTESGKRELTFPFDPNVGVKS